MLIMARPESRFIQKLTKAQVQQLEALRDNGESKQIRQRAHAVLLSFQRTSVNELVKIFQTSRNTICSWLDRWEAEGLAGLPDKPRPGARPSLDEEEQVIALKLLRLTPQSLTTVLLELEKKTGKTISKDTLRRLAKKSGLVWKRMRKSLRSKRDQKNFATST
jgi:transposase